MTVILITHSMDMIKMVDKIVILDFGVVVEEGGYGKLLRRNGAFASLIKGEAWYKEKEMVKRRSVTLMERALGVNHDLSFD